MITKILSRSSRKWKLVYLDQDAPIKNIQKDLWGNYYHTLKEEGGGGVLWEKVQG